VFLINQASVYSSVKWGHKCFHVIVTIKIRKLFFAVWHSETLTVYHVSVSLYWNDQFLYLRLLKFGICVLNCISYKFKDIESCMHNWNLAFTVILSQLIQLSIVHTFCVWPLTYRYRCRCLHAFRIQFHIRRNRNHTNSYNRNWNVLGNLSDVHLTLGRIRRNLNKSKNTIRSVKISYMTGWDVRGIWLRPVDHVQWRPGKLPLVAVHSTQARRKRGLGGCSRD
jgi:hypothetical protein